MAPAFLKDLRRRSKASFRTNNSTDTSSEGANSHGTAPSSGSITPPSVAHQSDPALNTQIKDGGSLQNKRQGRPALPPSASNSSRNSVPGMSGLGSPSLGSKQNLPLSQYAPRVLNITEGSWVYQKVILVYGTIGESLQRPIDGIITASRFDDSFPPVSWPVCDSNFKLLLNLHPGPNKIRLDFSSPKLANSSSSNPIHSSFLTLHMLPTLNAPPLQLAIVLASDSPETFDATPARAEREGNGLETAVKKFRMAAYLWQAFTAEQMWRKKLGRRTFRFEEEWIRGTTNQRDGETGTMRSEARVHIVRCEKTTTELRDLNIAQQCGAAADKDALFSIAADAVKKHLNLCPGQKSFVSVLLLDSHWDRDAKTIRGHAALGGNVGDLHLAMFGSHCLHSYPASFEEVVPAFTDCTPTDTNLLANDCNDAGSYWEAANVGIGAHLHEVGHLFGCPHQEEGIMLRDYVVLNRTFVPREAYSSRTKSKGGLALQGDECGWHRLDCLRFRAHPAFRLPSDLPTSVDAGVQAFAVENNNILVVAPSGIAFVELFGETDDVCRSWIEFSPETNSVQRQVTLTEQELRSRLGEGKSKAKMRLSIKSTGGGSLDINDWSEFISKHTSIKLGSGKVAFRSCKLGSSQMDASEPDEVLFVSAVNQDRFLARIIVYNGAAVDGMEFVFDDDSSQLFGKRGGKTGGECFELDVRRGEYLSGFVVRAGFFIDGIQIMTSSGRKSPMFGNAHGGSVHSLIPPRGYSICGVSGSCGPWLDGFSILIKR